MGKDSFISPSMINAVKQTIEEGNQVLLYLNRRGYAPLTICKACGHKVECPNCTAFLVEHKHKKYCNVIIADIQVTTSENVQIADLKTRSQHMAQAWKK